MGVTFARASFEHERTFLHTRSLFHRFFLSTIVFYAFCINFNPYPRSINFLFYFFALFNLFFYNSYIFIFFYVINNLYSLVTMTALIVMKRVLKTRKTQKRCLKIRTPRECVRLGSVRSAQLVSCCFSTVALKYWCFLGVGVCV